VLRDLWLNDSRCCGLMTVVLDFVCEASRHSGANIQRSVILWVGASLSVQLHHIDFGKGQKQSDRLFDLRKGHTLGLLGLDLPTTSPY
jgi:hypothetical protein